MITIGLHEGVATAVQPDPASLDRRQLNSRLSVGLAARNKTLARVNLA
jgi:hypothetical protein